MEVGMKTPEATVLRACLDYLRINGHFVARINNGAFETKRGNFVRCTDVPGWPDISGVTFDGKALAVECKSDIRNNNWVPTEKQRKAIINVTAFYQTKKEFAKRYGALL